MSKSLRLTPLGSIEVLPKVKRNSLGIKVNKLLTMYKPKDTKEYPMEHIVHTYVDNTKRYPYNSKKRGWNAEETA